jgi:hypothetical protein
MIHSLLQYFSFDVFDFRKKRKLSVARLAAALVFSLIKGVDKIV